MNSLFENLISGYGEKKWGVSMYDGQTALIANYINPIIGDMEVQAVTPRAVDGYIQTLQKTKSVSNGSEITGRRRNKKTLQTPKKGLQRCFLASQRGFEPPTPRLGAQYRISRFDHIVTSRIVQCYAITYSTG